MSVATSKQTPGDKNNILLCGSLDEAFLDIEKSSLGEDDVFIVWNIYEFF